MKKQLLLPFLAAFLLSNCSSEKTIEDYGVHYQKHHDLESLQEVVNRVELNADTSYVSSILGEPIDMGFDYRYLVDSVSERNCSFGAVFHINDEGKIDDKWIDEICE